MDKSTPDSGMVTSGQDADAPIGFTLKDGHEYGWGVYAQDNSSIKMKSAVSDHCWFDTDFTPSQTPTIADNPHFPSVGSGAGDTYAGTKVTADFPVTAADNTPADTCDPAGCKSSGIDHFLWQLDSQPTATTGTLTKVTSTSGATASGTVTIPVTDWGVHTLYVAAVDQAGNISQNPASTPSPPPGTRGRRSPRVTGPATAALTCSPPPAPATWNSSPATVTPPRPPRPPRTVPSTPPSPQSPARSSSPPPPARPPGPGRTT
ncbi:hypothetical protein ABZ307_13985 [Streptomyces griseorubiginosus]|uniref:hypothetical protein n=1 Tax=Streptomyces griseorubiginosus TaxID=67304 RepID=UPI0033A7602C